MRQHEGWELALDIQMDTHKWCMENHGEIFHQAMIHSLFTRGNHIPHLHEDSPEIKNIVHHLQETLWRADTIFVTRDMQHLLMQAAHDLPDDFVFDFHDLLSPRGFVLFEEPMEGTDLRGGTVMMHGILWEHSPVAASEKHPESTEAIMVYMLTDPHDFRDSTNEELLDVMAQYDIPVPPLLLSHIYPHFPWNTVPEVNDEPGQAIVAGIVRIFVALQLLAQQTIGEPMKLRPPRAQRKRAISWDRDRERYITLITLRRKTVKKDDHVPQTIERTHRWIVRGHWRKQPYKKTGTWAWKYIYEHIRGPEDKPLLISERRVFNFRR